MKYKLSGFKVTLILLIILFIPVLFIGCQAEGDGNISLEETFSGNYFELDYPKAWEEVEVLQEGVEMGDIFQIGSDVSKFIVIVQEDVHHSLEEFMDIDQLKAVTPGFELIEEKEIKLEEKEAYNYIFTGKDEEGKTVKYSQVATIKDNNAYVINFYTEKELFEEEIEIAEKMIDSFRFK